MQTSLFDFHLPEQLIAQEPLPDRDASRLLVLDRTLQGWRDSQMRSLPEFFEPGDLLVLNDTRVIPARLRATRDSSGGKIEILLLPLDAGAPEAGPVRSVTRRVFLKSGGKLLPGEAFSLAGGPKVILRERSGEAGDVVEFQCAPAEFDAYVLARGEVPLPPYVRRPAGPPPETDRQRYQTVYAQVPGAVAAPTAGLHFSEDLFRRLNACGVECRYLTLHVGPGTFRPVKADVVEEHFVDPEPYVLPAETIAAVRRTRANGHRVIAVGTTSLRTLEGACAANPDAFFGGAPPCDLRGKTNLFVYPPYEFKVASGLLTNFHIPRSSLLMLVSAFAQPGSTAGIGFVQRAYEHAVAAGYRFYSYGDASLFL